MTEEEKAAFKGLVIEVERLKLKVKILEHGFVKNNMALFEEEETKAGLMALEVEE